MDQTAQSRDVAVTSFGHVRELFNRRNVGAMLFLIGMYGIWNLWAGTNGFFLPFILRTVGSEGQAMSVTIQCVSFAAGIASIFFIFMRLVDRVDQRGAVWRWRAAAGARTERPTTTVSMPVLAAGAGWPAEADRAGRHAGQVCRPVRGPVRGRVADPLNRALAA